MVESMLRKLNGPRSLMIVFLHLGKLLGYERIGQDQTLHRDRSVTLGFSCFFICFGVFVAKLSNSAMSGPVLCVSPQGGSKSPMRASF